METLSLLREKFTIRDANNPDIDPVLALGNRLKIDLPNQNKPLIIRGHSMHMTLRFGAEILKQMTYISHIEDVAGFFRWQETWEKLIRKFEKEHTPEAWIVVYYQGKVIFDYNPHHMFFDVIEQCEHKHLNLNDGRYEQSIILAQQAFKKSGRGVFIEQESHVGFILDISDLEARFAVILRLPNQKATFITRMSVDEVVKKKPYPHVCMNFSADYIEAINMAVRSGFLERSLAEQGKASVKSPETKIFQTYQKRLTQLDLAIHQIENQFIVKYRPEKPDFKNIQKTCKEG